MNLAGKRVIAKPRSRAQHAMDAVPERPKESSGEIPSLTSIRGVAAFWVVLVHVHKPLREILPESVPLDPVINAGTYAVPLFFILSGYVLGLRYLGQFQRLDAGQILRFLWLRIGRIYPVHLLTLLVSMALVTRHGWPSDAAHSPRALLSNLLLVHAWDRYFELTWNYPSWSISSEWFAYLAFPLLAIALGQVGKSMARALTGVALLAAALAYSCEAWIPFKGLFLVVPTFAGGVLMSVVLPPAPNPGHAGRIAGLAVLCAVPLPYLLPAGPVLAAAYVALFFLVIGLLGLAGPSAGSFWNSRPATWLGRISYSLYLSHGITVTLLSRFVPLERLQSEGFPLRLAGFAGLMTVILVVAAALHHAFERPMIELFRRRFRPTVPGSPRPG